MAIRISLSHKTRYSYDRLVQLTPQIVRLRPAPHCRTPISAYSLKVKPSHHFINWQQDPYSNYVARLVFPEPADHLEISVNLVAEMTVINPFDFFIDTYAEHYPFVYQDAQARELMPYLEKLPETPHFKQFMHEFRMRYLGERRRTVDVLVDLNQMVQRTLKYDIRMEPGVQPPEETLEKSHGSCRDFTWLMVQAARSLGLASRFVSGYSIQLVADVKPLDGPAGVSKDVTDLHAWTEIFLPGAGWVGLDSTSGLMCGEGHIPLAATAEPGNAAPIFGGFAWIGKEEGKDAFSVEMSVARLYEDPRVTKPYTEAQWIAIDALGDKIDDVLQQQDMRLSMGGEPTFISIDDMEGPEWNTLAMGPDKRRLSGVLLKRLRDRFSPGGLLHFGQGKWYPGESLPRYAFGCYWRKDNVPIWTNPALVAEEGVNGDADYRTAGKFMAKLCEALDVNAKYAMPAYEDVWYYLWKERRLPTNVDPLQNKLENEEDRKRLAKVFEQGLSRIIGYALPLRPTHWGASGKWESGEWFLRPERMYLIPGDSPMGLRLPLDSLPWVAAGDLPFTHEQDLWEPRQPLPDFRTQKFFSTAIEAPGDTIRPNSQWIRQQQTEFAIGSGTGRKLRPLGPDEKSPDRTDDPTRRVAQQQSAPWIIRTAMCAEARGGILHIFMPPVRYLEDYLDLVARIEATAAAMETPVRIEGYPPPADPRMEQIKITPDPGVIEVNVHPAHSWRQLVRNTTALYEEARASRLGTDKFQLDGRHTGTGGGNHIVVGAAVPSDSPFLRRPDLLKSLVGYWNNHPSLSYLFSGLFIGPTSQAPRADEGRPDLISEIQTAFKQVPNRISPQPAPWLVDRIFRNLLVDSTGNTHRAEFCIDKLYSPDSSSGRLGLVEFRGFEMPPHARMSLTQQLLLRGLLATFWKNPYERPLVKWGTELHDKFMLGHFVREDFSDVLADIELSGFPFSTGWFDTHYEFRFPHIGTINRRGVELELRQALEPWYVLGEQGAAGGTVRYVDSSLERVQILVNGMTDPRHVVTCNGHTLPLRNTGTCGQYVAGVRYKAWAPSEALHPTIPVHTPLVFDLVDMWNGRSVGGCSYYVSHPAGRNYTSFPVNALEAESRRIARFFNHGHTQRSMNPPPAQISTDFPLTLDLRQVPK